MEELFKLIGLGVPFYLGAATYAVFAWLDSNASDEATKVISSWLHGRSHNKPDLGNLILNAFDRVYTSPLLSLRAFRRSAAISSIVWVLVFGVVTFLRLVSHFEIEARLITTRNILISVVIIDLIITLFYIIVVDYLSLFFVRRFLIWARIRPMSASILSSIIGAMVVIGGSQILGSATLLLGTAIPWDYSLGPDPMDSHATASILNFIIVPALIIHLWLPLFALSSLLVKLLYLMFRAVEWAQWFLKQGDGHPLKAIGIVATIIVFGSAMLVKEGWALLSVL
jgi:hypothetical protein